MAADDAAVVVTLRANIKDYEAALKSAVRATERAAASAEKAISNVGKGKGGGASNVVAVNFQKSASQIANDARVLQFQLNDIFSGIASGQGIRALQVQLGQIAQQMSGGSLAQGARTMGAALVGMINPINLAVVAFGFLATAAAEYFLGAEEDAEKANKALADHAAAVRKMADAWGDLVPGLREVADELERLRKIQDLVSAAGEVTADRLSKVADEVQKIVDTGGAPVPFLIALEDLKKAGEDVITVMKDGKGAVSEYAEFQKQLAAILESDAVRSNTALTKAITELATAYTNAAMAASQLHAQEAAREGTRGRMQGGLSGDQFNARFGQRYGKTNEELFPSLYRAREEAQRKAAAASKKAANEAEREAEKAADKINDAIARQTAVAVDAAASLIGQDENTNRSSINAFLRAGGVDLDAATTAWCAAFVNSALAQVGVKGSGSNVATDFLNFGKAVQPGEIQRGDVLVQPKGHRAGEQGGHVGFATGNLRATAEGITQIEMLSGNAANQVATDWVNVNDVVARRAADAFALPAGALDHITEASKTAVVALSEAEKAAMQFQQATQQAVSGLIKDLIAGKDASEAFADALGKIADKAIDLAISGLFGMGGPGAKGGLLGGMLIPGILHEGGVAGKDGYGSGRMVSASTFRNAKRYHSGGLVGGEVPAILQRGEMVLPKESALRPGGGSNSTHRIVMQDDSGRMAEIADQRIRTASGDIIQISTQTSMKAVKNNFSKMAIDSERRQR